MLWIFILYNVYLSFSGELLQLWCPAFALDVLLVPNTVVVVQTVLYA